MAKPAAIHIRDARANQPAASVGNEGVIFCVTDEGFILEISNGTTWDEYSPAAPAATGTIASQDADSVAITGGSITNLTTLELPVSATPTVANDGEIALDTTVADFSHGVIKFFGTEEQGVVSMPIAGFTTPSDGHVVAYNATNDEFELVAQTSGVTDAADLTYTPTTLADWDGGVDPGDGQEAFDQLAERVTDLEGAGGGAFDYTYIPAGAITPSVTGGCQSLTTIASAANQPDIQTLNFDATTQEYAQFSLAPPSNWSAGTVTFEPVWSHPSTTTNFGVVWDLQAVAVSNDDAIAVAFGTAQTSTDTGGTTDDLYTGPASSAITIAGTPTAGDMVFFRISRVTGNGSDTMAVDARLHGVRVHWA